MHDPKLYKLLRSDSSETREAALSQLMSGDYLETFQRLAKGIYIQQDSSLEMTNGCEAYWRVHEDLRETAVYCALFKTGKIQSLPFSDHHFIVDEALYKQLSAEASSEHTLAERLGELSEYQCVALKVAANPSTSESTLDSLCTSNNKEVRGACIRNENLGSKSLSSLGGEFPELFKRHPVYKLLHLAGDDELYKQMPLKTQLQLLSEKEIDNELLLRIASPRNGQLESKLALLSKPSIDKSIVDALLKDESKLIKIAAALHVSQPSPDWTMSVNTVEDIIELEKSDGLLDSVYMHECYDIHAWSEILEVSAYEESEWDDESGGETIYEVQHFCPCDPYIPAYILPYDADITISRERRKLAQLVSSGGDKFDAFIKGIQELNLSTLKDLKESITWVSLENSGLELDYPVLLEAIANEKVKDKRELLCNLAVHLARNIKQRNSVSQLDDLLIAKLLELNEVDARLALACAVCLPSSAMKLLASDNDPCVRRYLAINRGIDSESLILLLSDENREIRQAAAENSRMELDFLSNVKTSEKLIAKLSILQREGLDEAVLTELGSAIDDRVREAVAKNWQTPISTLTLLSKDSRRIRLAVASNPSIPIEVAAMFANSNDEEIRSAIASNAGVPSEILKTLTTDKCTNVRISLALNSNAPDDVLKTLAYDNDKHVRVEVAKCRNSDVLLMLVADKTTSVKKSLAQNEDSTFLILEPLSNDKDNDIRVKVARNIKTPVELLLALSSDEYCRVRAGVADNSNTPPSILEKLSTDEDEDVRRVIAKNVNTPCDILTEFTESSRLALKAAAFNNPSLPEEAVRNVAIRFSQALCEEVFDVDSPLRGRGDSVLFRDPLRLFCLKSSECDPDILRENYNSINWLERFAIASNKAVPLITLLEMQNDGNILVRAAASRNTNARAREAGRLQ